MLYDPQSTERLEIGGKAYLLKVPTVAERVKWRMCTLAAGGKQHGQFALLSCMAAGVRRLMADTPEIRDALLAKIETHRQNLVKLAALATAGVYADAATNPEAAEKLKSDSDALRASSEAIAGIERAVSEGYQRYLDMAADDAAYPAFAGVEAARLLLVGWEGFEAPLQRQYGQTGEASLAMIPEAHFPAIAAKMEQLCQVPEAKRKNSASPPPSSSGGETSST